MDFVLDPVEVRVLGCLVEKEITTPEYYPLTLNALLNACNQKSNREPVVSYDEQTVERALESLRYKKLAMVLSGPGIRAPKHSHRFAERLNLGRRETALMCVLMLRGHQTAGELHSRTERMHEFSDLEEVESVLQRLSEWDPGPLVMLLPRQPGAREPRWAHLLAGEVTQPAMQPREEAAPAAPRGYAAMEERLAALEQEAASLREELREFQARFAEFRRQFE